MLTREEFEKLVEEAITKLPQEFLEKMDNVVIFVEDIPGPGQGFLLGLYQGIPQTRRGRYGVGGVVPDRITIYKQTTEIVAARSGVGVEQVIKDTIIHEIAHHFGIDDPTLNDIERGKSTKTNA
jgi:predicted Zn-dependent protease with MMP-like domain